MGKVALLTNCAWQVVMAASTCALRTSAAIVSLAAACKTPAAKLLSMPAQQFGFDERGVVAARKPLQALSQPLVGAIAPPALASFSGSGN
jgi:hypothetical protein